ncbi:hypothetical protein [Mailhella massiliensis]|uniref:hypothetical protein n=1 Tax=Mailhella massiliensis TaxID=1903261 RepID=UPI0012B549ED|nr:hypothetical protein [Mailhella massiliensis]
MYRFCLIAVLCTAFALAGCGWHHPHGHHGGPGYNAPSTMPPPPAHPGPRWR